MKTRSKLYAKLTKNAAIAGLLGLALMLALSFLLAGCSSAGRPTGGPGPLDEDTNWEDLGNHTYTVCDPKRPVRLYITDLKYSIAAIADESCGKG